MDTSKSTKPARSSSGSGVGGSVATLPHLNKHSNISNISNNKGTPASPIPVRKGSKAGKSSGSVSGSPPAAFPLLSSSDPGIAKSPLSIERATLPVVLDEGVVEQGRGLVYDITQHRHYPPGLDSDTVVVPDQGLIGNEGDALLDAPNGKISPGRRTRRLSQSLGYSSGCPVMHLSPRASSYHTDTTKYPQRTSSKVSPIEEKVDDDTRSSSSDGHSNNLSKLLSTEEYDSDEGDEMGAYEHMDSLALKREIKLLKRINAFTRDIAENSNQAIVVVEAASKKIYWVNGRAQTIFGKLADDLLDNNVNILIPPETARKHDKIMDVFLHTWARERAPPSSKVVNPRSPREIKAVRYFSDGSTSLFDAEIFVRYMRINGRDDKPPKFFMAYINDISELKQMKHQLNVSKVIQQKSAEAIVVCDLHGKIITCNSMTEQMFGTSLSFLLTHNKNIKWFMPRNIADKHDSYLSVWRDNLRAGYDMGKSTIIGKVRDMKGRRPGEKEDELFSIVLRVELVENELVAYIRDVSDTITKTEFNSALVGKVFPKCIKNKVLRAQEEAYEICEQLSNKTVVYTDLSEFTKYSNGAEVSEVYKFVNAMYKAFDVIVPQYSGEIVKRTGDGVIAVFGLIGNSKKHADRAIYCAISMLHWSHENGYKMRVGIASGDIGSGIFGDGESRPQWDVLGETVNIASRMQAYGVIGKVQINEATYNATTDPRLKGIFEMRVLEDVKGYGNFQAYLSTEFDILDLLPLLQRRLFDIDNEKKRILEREKRLDELQRGNKMQSTNDDTI